MQIVQPAYRTMRKDEDLQLTGVSKRFHYCVQTAYSPAAIEELALAYKENMLVLGFTKDACNGIPNGRTVDATIGLEAALVVLILEAKTCPRSHQYDIRRVVLALTRCTHGLVVMWQDRSYESIPWTQLRHIDGTYELYENICRRLYYERGVAAVVRWFVCDENYSIICHREGEDASSRLTEYGKIRNEIAAIDDACDEEEPEPDINDEDDAATDQDEPDESKASAISEEVTDNYAALLSEDERYIRAARLLGKLVAE